MTRDLGQGQDDRQARKEELPTASGDTVAHVDNLNRDDFYREFVAKRKPVVIHNMMSEWRARSWSPEYFKHGYSTRLPVKQGNVADGQLETVSLSSYAELLERYEAQLQAGSAPERPGYLHDVPLFRVIPALRSDVEPFPLHLFPRWYRQNWPNYVQFFMGPTGSVTPLHFDTLLTNNLFFQVAGRKRFVLIPDDQRGLCYTYNWRWAQFDPTAPDFAKFPLAERVTPAAVVLEPGDILYMPPGTLHHVTSLSLTISFNIDWHTAASAARGMTSVARGAPRKNGYYNLVSLLGVGLGIPDRYLYPLYKSYLTYVS